MGAKTLKVTLGRAVGTRLSRIQGPRESGRILADQLILYQLRGKIMPTTLVITVETGVLTRLVYPHPGFYRLVMKGIFDAYVLNFTFNKNMF